MEEFMKLLFSIAVHESSESINDMIQNINYFVKKPVIVLHVKKGSELSINKVHNVYINENSYITGFSDASLSAVHLSNFYYSKSKEMDFDYFLPFGSNQLFIRSGIEEYLDGVVCSHAKPVSTSNYHYKLFKRDKLLKSILGSYINKTAPEGTFYKKSELEHKLKVFNIENYFNIIIPFYESEYGAKYRRMCTKVSKLLIKLKLNLLIPSKIARYSYASEEFLFPSIFTNEKLTKEKYCFIPWAKKNFKVEIEEIKEILDDGGSFFSVKRVERNIDDEVRTYIREVVAQGYH